nr:hypothetical protein [Tanacetum cinerariifolium]
MILNLIPGFIVLVRLFHAKFAMRKPPYLLVSPTLALRSSLKRIVTTSGQGFDDWQCRLATLPFTFFLGREGVQCLLCSRWPCGNLITLLTSLGGLNFSRVQLASRFFVGDIYGDRVVSCIAGKKVDIGLGGGRGKLLRPTDMSLYSCDVRIDVFVDLIRSSPLTQMGMTGYVPDHVGIYAA